VTVDARRSPGGLWLPAPGRVCHWLLPFPLQSAGFLITLVMPLLLLVILNIITPGSAGTVPGRWVTRSSSPLRNCSVRCFSPAAQGSDGRSRASQHSEHITTWSASFNAKSNQPGKPTITAGRRALIWPIHHAASAPAIMSVHSTITSGSLDIYADQCATRNARLWRRVGCLLQGASLARERVEGRWARGGRCCPGASAAAAVTG